MLEQLKSAVKNPDFQRQVALGAGKIVSFVIVSTLAKLVDSAVDTGINAIMDKVQKTTESTES
jgi:hypothetical protein